MAIETKRKTIGGTPFEVTQLPYFRAQRLFVRLLKLGGPALTGLLTIAGGTSGKAALSALGSADAEKLAPILADFFEKLDPADAETITREILATARARQGDGMVNLLDFIDVVIGGDFWTGMALQAWALSVHFGNFSSARDGLASLGLNLKGSPSSESSTSTGSKAESSSAAGGAG